MLISSACIYDPGENDERIMGGQPLPTRTAVQNATHFLVLGALLLVGASVLLTLCVFFLQILHNLLNKLTHLERYEESLTKHSQAPPADSLSEVGTVHTAAWVTNLPQYSYYITVYILHIRQLVCIFFMKLPN